MRDDAMARGSFCTIVMIGADPTSWEVPELRFLNRVVVVTGGAKGIGEGCCRVFCREGAQVAILDRDEHAAESFAAELMKSGIATSITCDVAEQGQLRSAIEQVAERFGRIDCLINNAGVHPDATSIDDTSVEDMERLMRVNYLSTFAGCKYAMPHLRKTHGTIVNISSMTAVLGQHLSTAYCATKAAQIGLTKSLAIEAGPDGVRVNAILPSNVDTPLMREWASSLADPQSALDRVAALQVFGRMASPEEIGKIALFLATDDSSFLTGQAIEAEGGASLDY
jgi:L-fucose dehydrogenase